MTIREASFGDLFKIAFWVHLGPTLMALVFAGLFVSAVFVATPELPAAMVELGVPGVPAGFAAFSTLQAVGVVWLIALAYAVALTAFSALRTLSGAVTLIWWRRVFMRTTRPAVKAKSAPLDVSAQPAE